MNTLNFYSQYSALFDIHLRRDRQAAVKLCAGPRVAPWVFPGCFPFARFDRY